MQLEKILITRFVLGVVGLADATPADAQGATVAPADLDTLLAPVHWMQELLLGTAATVVAVIAVASIGLLMLTGRIDWRRGATVITGCFVVFGAPVIAAGIHAATSEEEVYAPPGPPVRTALPPLLPHPPGVPSPPIDPYAGASPARTNHPVP